MDYISFIRPFLSRLGEIEGISEEEIAGLEAEYNVRLPEAYKQYMLIFGRKTGYFMRGAAMRMDQLDSIAEFYQEDLVAYSTLVPLPLGENWFFFGNDMGRYLYFECDGNPDPKVWIMLGIDEVKEMYPSFTSFLKDEVDSMSKYWK